MRQLCLYALQPGKLKCEQKAGMCGPGSSEYHIVLLLTCLLVEQHREQPVT